MYLYFSIIDFLVIQVFFHYMHVKNIILRRGPQASPECQRGPLDIKVIYNSHERPTKRILIE